MFEELNDELLGQVSGGDMYHFSHKRNYQCEYGDECILKLFPWGVCKDGENIYSMDRPNEKMCLCSDKNAAIKKQKCLNKDSEILKITNIVMSENVHQHLCDLGICFRVKS